MQTILVIEDDIDIQDILKNHLVDAGYDVITASDGVSGIAKFNNEISLVLLDIMLPKIDGYKVCEVIRQKSNHKICIQAGETPNYHGNYRLLPDSTIFSPIAILSAASKIAKKRGPPTTPVNPSTLNNPNRKLRFSAFPIWKPLSHQPPQQS